MKIHHLNCGSLRSPGAPPLVCHVLLIETDDGLMLVDSGFGIQDCADPGGRLGITRFIVNPVLDADEAAVRQIERLGFAAEDVRHIVATHFDLDHIGGIADFPAAQVHVTAAEHLAAITRGSVFDKLRYRPAQWAHGPAVVEHDPRGESWRGFAAAKEILPGVVMVSMPGHTQGHTCVAVDIGNRWILHAGDAFYHYGTLDGKTKVPVVLRLSESVLAVDRKQVMANQQRLAELHQRGESDLMVINAHDPTLLKDAQSAAAAD